MTATRRTATIPMTKEWKLQRCFNTGEDRGKDGSKATPKGPAITAQRELEADPEGDRISLEPKVLLLPTLSH